MKPPSRSIRLFAFDIDGTLTDGTTWFAGEELGWVQRYSVRDGEAILRLRRRGVVVVPLSCNKTRAAAQRMVLLGCETRWVGISDKRAALEEMVGHFAIEPEAICYVGDGADDAELFDRVGIGCAVRDAHPRALELAHYVTRARGGERVIEELELLLEREGRIPPLAPRP